jgi:hypothetical protein
MVTIRQMQGRPGLVALCTGTKGTHNKKAWPTGGHTGIWLLGSQLTTQWMWCMLMLAVGKHPEAAD